MRKPVCALPVQGVATGAAVDGVGAAFVGIARSNDRVQPDFDVGVPGGRVRVGGGLGLRAVAPGPVRGVAAGGHASGGQAERSRRGAAPESPSGHGICRWLRALSGQRAFGGSNEPQRNMFRAAVRRLKIRHCPAYNMRHTYACASLQAPMKPGWVAAQLGRK